MKLKTYFAAVGVLLLITAGCKDKGTNPPVDEMPPGYQENIPWPSLAESPWPMYSANPQLNGRTKFLGARLGEIENIIDSVVVGSNVVIGPDSNFYFFSTSGRTGLFSFDKDGHENWFYEVESFPGVVIGIPLIDEKNTIFFANSFDGYLYALNSDGTLKWKKFLDVYGSSFMNINKNGQLFVWGKPNKLLIVNRNGELIDEISNNNFLFRAFSFSPDGETIYFLGKTEYFAMDNLTHNIKWHFGNEVMQSFNSPVVDSKGNIYAITSTDNTNENHGIYCLGESGKINWKYLFGKKEREYYSPCIDKNGNVYFGYDTLYSVNYKGDINWKKQIDYRISSPISCDGGNNIYVIMMDWLTEQPHLLSYNSDGLKRMDLVYNDYREGTFPSAIGYDNTLYISSYRSEHIFIIK